MRKGMLIGVAVGATMLSTGSALASAPLSRPTAGDARWATQKILGTYADALDGTLVVAAGCVPRGTLSRVCRARIDGPVRQHFRVIVTTTSDSPDGRLFSIRARPMP